MYKKIIASFLSISCFVGMLNGVAVSAGDISCNDTAKNVIYIIGEGMGANLIQYTQWKYTSAYDELNMQKMSVSGLVSTYSADSGTSDDASGGTQLATGSGTDNGSIGVGAELDNYREYENLMEAAARSEKSTGIISDSEFSDSVAAAFMVHSSDMDDAEEIQAQIDNSEIDVKVPASTSLTDDTVAVLENLSTDEDGFVLVIDSAKIEKYISENNSTGAMEAVKVLDDVVGTALDFAEQDGETLVIVTAEHEAGSVAETALSSRSGGSDTITWLSTAPSNTNVMLFAQGRGAEHFNGYYHNTDICRKIAHITGITDWDFYDVKTEFETPEATEAPAVKEDLEILSYDFENTAEGIVYDLINENNAELTGNAEVIYDETLGSNVLKLDNTSETGNYLTLPRGVFDNMQSLTVEMDIKSSQTYDLNSSTFQIANQADPTMYFYFKYEPLGQGIRYSLNPGSDWKSSGNQEITDISGEDWVNLKFVAEPTKHTVYINNEEFLTYETKGSISMLGSDLYAYIGHSMFSVDKDYSGSIDNIKISGIKQEEVEEEVDKIKTSVDVTPAEPVTDENDLPQNSESDKAKNVIILIGDGMGQNITQLSQWYYNGAANPYTMQTMPYIGLSKTYSQDNGVTDSAAGGTAMATGRKTNNGYISTGNAETRFKTLMEYAQDKNMATGILSTTDITDATPAVFAAHAADRSYRDVIAKQQAESGVDIFMGGGGEHFTDLIDDMTASGYKYITTEDEMNALDDGDKVLGLFGYSGDLVQPIDGNTTEPLLPEMVEKSIEMLDGRTENGFVLMAEGATIDHYAHSNVADGAVDQTKIFDDAVKVALDFAKQDGNTLVIVTADHETGGLALLENSSVDASTSISGKYAWTTGNHSSAYVPIYAYGPGAEKLTGIHENTDIFKIPMNMLGLEEDTRSEADEENRLILDLNFDNEDLSTENGSAVAKGTLSYEDGYRGKAVSFDGNSENYIELFDDEGESLLDTTDTFTVSYWSKTDSSNSPNWMFYTAPGPGAQLWSYEMYIGLLDDGNGISVERYCYGRYDTPYSSFTADEWKHVTVVIDSDKTMLYINGKLQSTVETTAKLADILELAPVSYIGRANWGDSGESAVGLVDEFKIHNYCLSEEQITTLYEEGYLPEDIVTGLYAEYMSDEINYTVNVKNPDNEDVYVALYDNEGVLVDVNIHTAKTVIKGSFIDLTDESYTIGAYIWKKGTMTPVWGDKQVIRQYKLKESVEGSQSGGGSRSVSFADSEFTAENQILQLR